MNLSERDKKTLLIGAVAVCLFLLFKFVFFPLSDRMVSRDESIAVKKHLLEKYEKALKNRPKLALKRDKMKAKIEGDEKRFLPGDNPSIASAKLQTILEGITRKGQATLKSVKTIKAERIGDYLRVGVEITFISDLRSLSNLLYELEHHEISLSIVALNVRLQGEKRGKPSLLTRLRVVSGMISAKAYEKKAALKKEVI